jgi:hypothetical protein
MRRAGWVQSSNIARDHHTVIPLRRLIKAVTPRLDRGVQYSNIARSANFILGGRFKVWFALRAIYFYWIPRSSRGMTIN